MGCLVAALGLVIHLVTTSHWAAVGTWALGGPVAILCLALFVQQDSHRRMSPWYVESPMIDWLRRLLVVLALVVVILSAWTIADAIARSTW